MKAMKRVTGWEPQTPTIEDNRGLSDWDINNVGRSAFDGTWVSTTSNRAFKIEVLGTVDVDHNSSISSDAGLSNLWS